MPMTAIDLRRIALSIEAGTADEVERRAAADALRALAMPARRPGQRSASTVLGIERHAAELRAMRARFYPEATISAAAAAIHHRLSLYRAGPDWRRDRAADAIAYSDTIRGACWRALRAHDRVLSVRRIRAVLATSSAC